MQGSSRISIPKRLAYGGFGVPWTEVGQKKKDFYGVPKLDAQGASSSTIIQSTGANPESNLRITSEPMGHRSSIFFTGPDVAFAENLAWLYGMYVNVVGVVFKLDSGVDSLP